MGPPEIVLVCCTIIQAGNPPLCSVHVVCSLMRKVTNLSYKWPSLVNSQLICLPWLYTNLSHQSKLLCDFILLCCHYAAVNLKAAVLSTRLNFDKLIG